MRGSALLGPVLPSDIDKTGDADVALVGRRFLMIKDATPPGEAAAPPQLVVVQNWHEELKRLVPR